MRDWLSLRISIRGLFACCWSWKLGRCTCTYPRDILRCSQSTSKLVATMMMMICEKGKKRCGVHAFSRCIKSTNNIEISRLSATVVYIFVRVETRTFGLLRIGVRNGWQEGHLSYQGTSKIKPSDVYYISKLTRDSWVPFLIHPPLFFHLSLSLSFSFNG